MKKGTTQKMQIRKKSRVRLFYTEVIEPAGSKLLSQAELHIVSKTSKEFSKTCESDSHPNTPLPFIIQNKTFYV